MPSSFQGRTGTAPEEGIKAPVVCRTSANITLSGEQTVSTGGTVTTKAVVAGDRILAGSQTDASENGIYTVSASAWTRATDFNAANDVISGILVTESTNNTIYMASFSGTYTAGTTEVAFTLAPTTVSQRTVVANVTALKALDVTTITSASTEGGATQGDGNAMDYYYSSGATDTADDENYITPTTGGGRWIAVRELDKNLSTENVVINGDFIVNQRGNETNTPSTTSAYYLDMWRYVIGVDGGSLGSEAMDRVAFTIGQIDVPNEPRYYASIAGTVSGGSDSEVVAFEQRIEDVRTLAGQEVTLSFYLKGSGSGTVGYNLRQYFGLGGSPSTTVDAVVPTDIAITTSWVRHEYTFTVPSISGKTIGTSILTSYLSLNFLKQIGSTLKAAQGGTGSTNFTGSMYVADVSLRPARSGWSFPRRSYGDVLARCKRYFQIFTINDSFSGLGISGNEVNGPPVLFPEMRVTPTSSLSSAVTNKTFRYDGTATGATNTTSITSRSSTSLVFTTSNAGIVADTFYGFSFNATPTVELTAEL